MKVIVMPSAPSWLFQERRGSFNHLGRRADARSMIEQTLTQPARRKDVLHRRIALRDERRHERPIPRVVEAPFRVRSGRAIRTEIDETLEVDELPLGIDNIETDIDVTTTAM